MSRYSDDMPKWFIDAKALWKELIEIKQYNKSCDAPFAVNMGINQAIGLLNMLPAADAVEVVRCKDCKHWWKKNEVCTHPKCCDSFLAVVEAPPEHFCGYGERKRR